MGAKINVDLAALMNNGPELIEVGRLFGIPADKVGVVVHAPPIVHSLVESCDNSWIAQLSVNDMIFSIPYALACPDRWENEIPRLEPEQLGQLRFEPVDGARVPAVEESKS